MIKNPPTQIEVFRPAIGEEEIQAVADVMRSGWIGRGPKVDEFETAWAQHIGVPRECVLSLSCATEGLNQIVAHIRSQFRSDEFEIIVPDNAFIGTASAVLDNGLALRLCDVDLLSLNPSLADYLNSKNGYTVAVTYQHYGGVGVFAPSLGEACKRWKVSLIEDMACHPLGKPVGDFAVWSFDAMKVLTCGDGGMVYCRDPQAAESMRRATRLGMSETSGRDTQTNKWWEFKAGIPGRRAMMNDIQAAIGLVQLRRLPELVKRRSEIWIAYQHELKDLDWIIRPYAGQPFYLNSSSFYTYWVQLPGEGHRDRLALFLRERGIYTTYRYWPVHRAYGWQVDCPNSAWAADHTLNLPLHPGLSDGDVEYVCDTIREFGRTL